MLDTVEETKETTRVYEIVITEDLCVGVCFSVNFKQKVQRTRHATTHAYISCGNCMR